MKQKSWLHVAAWILTAAFLLPLLMMFLSSFMTGGELEVIYETDEHFRWIPYKVTLEGYWRLLFASETYIATFWNSMLIALASVFLHAVVSVIAGYALARGRFRGRTTLFFLYVLIMLMPFQVTLLPNYIMAKDLGIYNTWLALILPSAFAPLGVFLVRQFVINMPDDILQAAYLDTSSNLRILRSIVAPNIWPGILTVAILAFAECWNMVEQPLILIEDEWLYPLSMQLNSLDGASMAIRFPGAVFYVVPAVLLYFIFENELVDGVTHMKI